MNNPNFALSEDSDPAYRQFEFRQPTVADGMSVWGLIESSPPLDGNSQYCNILQCAHFPGTCVLAERDGEPMGWLSAYLLPEDAETVFIWQVAVHRNARGAGLASALIDRLLARPALREVKLIKTTITTGNKASWALFESLARRLDAPIRREEWLKSGFHFSEGHETEHLVTIGPIVNR